MVIRQIRPIRFNRTTKFIDAESIAPIIDVLTPRHYMWQRPRSFMQSD
jgi:hypothetical protein